MASSSDASSHDSLLYDSTSKSHDTDETTDANASGIVRLELNGDRVDGSRESTRLRATPYASGASQATSVSHT